MLRHIVLLQLQPEATDEQVDTIVAGLRALPDQVPGVQALTAGRDAGLDESNATVGFTADFADIDGWRAYRDHPAHKQLIGDHIAPVLAGKTAIQYET